MSLNSLIRDQYKPWLNIRVNDITVDGAFSLASDLALSDIVVDELIVSSDSIIQKTTITNADIINANIDNLVASDANIGLGNIDNLVASDAIIGTLYASDASIDLLVASDASIGSLSIDNFQDQSLLVIGATNNVEELPQGLPGQILQLDNGGNVGWNDNQFGSFIVDEKPVGTSGGASTTGGWIRRNINTIKYDPQNNVGLVQSDFIIMKGGTYNFDVRVPGYDCDAMKSRLIVNGGSTIAVSTSEFSSAGNGMTLNNRIVGRATFQSSDVIEIQQQLGAVDVNGLGRAANFTEPEIYTTIKFYKEV